MTSMATPVKAAAYALTTCLIDNDGDLVTSAVINSGLSSGAGKALISKDNGAWANTTGSVGELGYGMYELYLTATEMDADLVTIVVKTSTTNAKNTPIVLYTWGALPYNPNGAGSTEKTIHIQDELGNDITGAEVWITSDSAGSTVIAGTATTDDDGNVTFMLDEGTTVYVWTDSAHANFTNPYEWTVA